MEIKKFSFQQSNIENQPKIYKIKFDESHFGNRTIEPDFLKFNNPWIAGAINRWWEEICLKNNIKIDARIRRIKLLLIEIARNTFEKVGSGDINVYFEQSKITIIVSDQGEGFRDPNEQMSKGHGLYQVKNYADEFSIESNGKKFTKILNSEKLLETKDVDIKKGSKVTFVKNL